MYLTFGEQLTDSWISLTYVKSMTYGEVITVTHTSPVLLTDVHWLVDGQLESYVNQKPLNLPNSVTNVWRRCDVVFSVRATSPRTTSPMANCMKSIH